MPMGAARRMFNNAAWTMGTLGRERKTLTRLGPGWGTPKNRAARRSMLRWGDNDMTAAQVMRSGKRRVIGGAIGGSMVLSSFRNRTSSGSGRY